MGISIGNHEIEELGKIYENFEKTELKKLRIKRQTSSQQFPLAHLLILRAKSKICNNDPQAHKKWKFIDEAFKILDKNDSCSWILKVVAAWKKLRIYFDFKNSTSYYLDPMASLGTLANAYDSGIVHIGARDLSNETTKYKVIGAIIHEFCHIAILISYMNEFDPYPIGKSKERERYITDVVPECIDNQNSEIMISNVFNFYPKNHQNSELIVTVVQMIMHYHIRDPNVECENSIAIRFRRTAFEKLFSYFKDIVEQEFKKAISLLDILQDEETKIEFDQLTSPMKAAIVHAKIKFQGETVKFSKIVKENSELFKLLTQQQIRDVLLRKIKIEIGNVQKTSAKYKLVERKFINFDLRRENNEHEIKDFDKIKSEVKESNIFILADTPGAGKSVTFEHLSLKLKKSYSTSWVSFIQLRNYRQIFDEYFNKNQNLNLETITEILVKVIDVKTELEKKIFQYLFSNDRAILLFDGIDEICPQFNNFIVNILKTLKNNTNNQFFISTRPQHKDQLKYELKSDPFKLVSYTWNEKKELIKDILKVKNIISEQEQNEILSNFEKFYESINKVKYSNEPYEIGSPLLIQTITELYVDKKINLNSNQLDHYEIYEKIVNNQKEINDQKINLCDRDPFTIGFTLGVVHQALALKFLYGYNNPRTKNRLNELPIIKKWNKVRHNWTAEEIQRYGFVTIGINFKTEEIYDIDFTHRTYAEFFVAQYIISVFFNTHDNIKENFDKVCAFYKENLKFHDSINIFSFLNTYITNKIDGKVLPKKSRKLIVDEIGDNLQQIIFNARIDYLIDYIEFLLMFSVNQSDIYAKVWKINDEKNLLYHILINNNIIDYESSYLIIILKLTLGENFHQVFTKSNSKLNLTEEIIKYKSEYSKDDKHICQLIDIIECTFDSDDKLKIYSKILRTTRTIKIINFKIIKQYLENIIIAQSTLNLSALVLVFIYRTDEECVLKDLGIEIENFLNNNESYEIVLLDIFSHLIYKLLSIDNSSAIEYCIKVCIKNQKLRDKIKKLFMEKKIREIFFINLTEINCTKEAELIRLIFNLNIEEISKCIQLDFASKLLKNKEKFCQFENFMNYYFSGQEIKIRNCIREVLYYDYGDEHPLVNVLKSEENEYIVRDISMIYKKYQNSDKETQDFIKSNILTSKYVKQQSFIYELIRMPKNLPMLNNFLTIFFNIDQILIKEIVKEILFINPNFIAHLMSIGMSESQKEFQRIKSIFLHYSSSWNDFQKIFLTGEGLFKIFKNISLEIFPEVVELALKSLGDNKHLILEIPVFNEIYNLIENEQKFKLFKMFLIQLFEYEIHLVKDFLKNHLFPMYNSDKIYDSFHPFNLIMEEQNDNIHETSFKYQKTWTILKCYLEFFNFLKYVTAFDFQTENQIKEPTDSNIFESYEEYEYFNLFASKFLDKSIYSEKDNFPNNSDEYTNYEKPQNNIFLKTLYDEDMETFKKFKILYNKCFESWNLVQNAIISDFSLMQIWNMRNKIYKEYKSFLEQIFCLEKNKFKESILSKYKKEYLLSFKTKNIQDFLNTFVFFDDEIKLDNQAFDSTDEDE